jgi:DNA-binding LacI/PurR family transcriptional regulator
MTEPRVTIEDVARHARVSRQTVSNVLNSPHLVAASTRERVEGAINALGYRPHLAARQLRTRRSHVIGLRLEPSRDGINGAVLDRFLHGLTETAQRRGYRVLLFTATDDEGEVDEYRALLDMSDLDAFVLTSTHRGDIRTRWLAERGVPFVTFGRPWEDDAVPHRWVDVDGRAGVRMATEHLRRLGHRRIGFLGWPDGSDVGADREAGWRDAMTADGWDDASLDQLRRAVPDEVAAATAACADLASSGEPTAVVCASDSLALGAAGVLRASGAAVVGFDDTPVAAAVGISSVAQPLAAAAERAFDLVIGAIEHPDDDSAHALLTPRLVVRASSLPFRP